MTTTEMPCGFPDCDLPAHNGAEYCWGHSKQRTRGQALRPLRGWGRSPIEALESAMYAYVETDSEDDEAFARNRSLFLRAARRFGRQGSGGRPPMNVELALNAVRAAGGVRAAARLLGVSRNTIRAALRRASKSST